ncbi:phosphogluconate dehydrogenase (decarboxylating) [Pseudohyphozyma bogoriensis]|nr:phosphogluconate dehydrogenase (decarboxylating) [Pseudohyphozyma bogoriensis]
MSHNSHAKASYAKEKIGFAGMGNMGAPMAENLAAWLKDNDLPALTVWNRTESKMPPESASLKHAKSLKDLALTCDFVITSFASDEVVVQAYEELFAGAKEKLEKEGKGGSGTVFIETSTIYPTLAGKLEHDASKIHHVYYLQAPVFGTPSPNAVDASLIWVLSGDPFAKKRVRDFLVPSMGRKIIDVGSNVERASAFKLNGNFLTIGIIENLAEAMTLATRTGVGADLLMEFVKECLPAPSFIDYGTKIVNNDFVGNTGFTVEGGLKDANHIRHLAAGVDVTIPLIDLAHRNLIASRASGGGQLDWSSMVAGPRLAAGVQPFTGRKATPQDTGFGAKSDPSGGGEEPVPDGGVKTLQNF